MDSLSQIIHTLTPSEKRYFGMFATAFKTESGLMKLFESLSEIKEHDEKALTKKTGIKNITEGRSRLRNLLFKAMRSYREDVGAKQQLRNVLNDVDFLITKGLDDEARKELNKAWKVAEKFEAYNDQTEMLDRLSNIDQRTLKQDGHDESFDLLCSRMEEISRKQQEVSLALLHNRYVSFLIATHQYMPASPTGKDLNKIITSLNRMLGKAESPYGHCILLITMASCYQAMGSVKKALDIYGKTRSWFKKYPSLIGVSPTAYLVFIYNYSMIGTELPQKESWELVEEAEASISVLKDFFRTSPQKVIYYQQRLTLLKLTHAKFHKQWQLLGKLEVEAKHHLEEIDIKQRVIPPLVVAGLVSCFYETGNYKKALEWVSAYYQLDDAKVLKPLMTCIRVLEALAYYGNKQYDVSDNRCSNLYKTFIEQQLNDEYYKYLGKLLRKINHWSADNISHRKEIEELMVSFEGLKNNSDVNYHEQREYYDPIQILQMLLVK